MKNYLLIIIIFFVAFISGCGSSSKTEEEYSCYQKGLVTVYSLEEIGIVTSNNTRYDRNALTAAHASLPYGTKIKVTNLNNGRVVFLTVNDHNKPDGNYILKLSEKAANELAASDGHIFSIDIIKWG